MVVFERDGWACVECGTLTPRERQSVRAPDQPTIDHNVPLFMGGHHTYANVRLLCLQCNEAKGLRECPAAVTGRRK